MVCTARWTERNERYAPLRRGLGVHQFADSDAQRRSAIQRGKPIAGTWDLVDLADPGLELVGHATFS